MIEETAPVSVLGKRKDADPCRSLFAELGESKHGPEETDKATEEEEASGVEEEDRGDEVLGIFDRMRRRFKLFVQKMKEEEAKVGGEKEDKGDGEELTFLEKIQICNERLANGGGEKELEEGDVVVKKEKPTCEICKVKGHCYAGCPWRKELPRGETPRDMPSKWTVGCSYCHGRKFLEKTGSSCASCGRRTKKVLLKKCYVCWKTGHLDNSDKECLIFGQELTDENDPFRKFYLS